MNQSYVPNPFIGRRRPTRVVHVGDVAIGGDHPIRVQSMTNTDTRDIQATADQIGALADAGCEIARVTAPSIRDAECLADLKAELGRRKLTIPLVADIHFTPNAAMEAARHVEKVRINPGNYADKKRFEIREYSDAEYAIELERVAERFRPLVLRCRSEGASMRIGTNHGSLSDRIMNRFGDTPLGMVESALEFLDVCESEGYRELVFSMKASNTQVAIQAYRLLAERLARRAPDEDGYPFHLGVTEAGDGEDGRIKSAIGIGSLLEDGIGDTIRVSLTEDPVREIPIAAALARRSEARWREDAAEPAPPLSPNAVFVEDPYAHARRPTAAGPLACLAAGGDEPVRVELGCTAGGGDPRAHAESIAKSLARARDVSCEGLLVEIAEPSAAHAASRLRTALAECGLELPLALRAEPGLASDLAESGVDAERMVVNVTPEASDSSLRDVARHVASAGLALEWCLQGGPTDVAAAVDRIFDASEGSGGRGFSLSFEGPRSTHAARVGVARLRERGADAVPIVLRARGAAGIGDDEALLDAAIDLGAPLCDGIGDAVCLLEFGDAGRAIDLAYRILQGARLRTTRTEYISCPSCGRTLFDLEEITARIKRGTEHLKGVKIAVMGCIVNGPGEMADADFGYVGSGPGQVTLYSGQTVVARAVPEGEATDRLIEIIRDAGRWVDPG